jgi:hypothetical protein
MSDINTDSINTAYPQAGKDNSTQGFRDNFTAIRAALDLAHDEITQLENNTVKVNTENNFGGLGKITNALIYNSTGSVFINAPVKTDDFAVDWEQGQTQQYTLGSNAVITITNWPPKTDDGRAASLRLYLKSNTTDSRTVTFATVSTQGSGTVLKASGWNSAVAGDTVAYDFQSIDGGLTVYANRIGSYTA